MGIGARAKLELAHERAMRSVFPKVVSELTDVLGRPLVAYLGEVEETSAVDEWAVGKCEPSAAIQTRLRLALKAALMIEAWDGRRVAQAWFQGRSPQLDDFSPAGVLRDAGLDAGGAAVLAAARAFGRKRMNYTLRNPAWMARLDGVARGRCDPY